jgi:hypothetical protein
MTGKSLHPATLARCSSGRDSEAGDLAGDLLADRDAALSTGDTLKELLMFLPHSRKETEEGFGNC